MAAPRERAVPVQHPSVRSPARHAQPGSRPSGARKRGCCPQLAEGRRLRPCRRISESASHDWGFQMDELEQLITSYESQAALSVVSKLGVLIDLEALRDPRIVPFLLRVLADRCDPTEVRVHVLKRLRNGSLSPENRPLVADVILEVVSDRSNPDLRLQASLALGEFTDIE